MARYREALCKLCRREAEKLFLKGDRCQTDKCSIERRKYPPGQHGQRRAKVSDYAVQLREKQKVKRIYGLLESQFRKYYQEAEQKRGVTGEKLLQFLELRLDNMIYRMGFASNRNQARQMIGHGYFVINNRKINIPSCRLKVGDVVELVSDKKNLSFIQENLTKVAHKGLLAWIELDAAAFKGKLLHVPKRDEIPLTAKEQLIIEFYSK